MCTSNKSRVNSKQRSRRSTYHLSKSGANRHATCGIAKHSRRLIRRRSNQNESPKRIVSFNLLRDNFLTVKVLAHFKMKKKTNA